MKFFQKFEIFWIFKIVLAPACFKSVQSHQKNSFCQKKITDAAIKNYRKWPKFLSNFWIFGQNFQFFGPKFFSLILYPKTFLCAKNQDCTLKTWFVINFYRFWSKKAQFGLPPLTLDPWLRPPMSRICPGKISYGPKMIVTNLHQVSGRYSDNF